MTSVVALNGCTESLYLSSTQPLDDHHHVLVAPYFTKVENKVSVSIVAPPAKDASTPPGPPTVTVTLLPTPTERSYLYFSKNGGFNNSFNVSVGADGMLTSSDTTSVQQFTAILTELAQTAAAFLAPVAPGVPVAPAITPALPSDDRAFCAAAITKLTSSVPVYQTIGPIAVTSAQYPIQQTSVDGQDAAGSAVNKQVSIVLDVEIAPAFAQSTVPSVTTNSAGFVAYMPVPALVSLQCSVAGGTPLALSQSSFLSTYFAARLVDPKRDLLTNPAETFTLTEGFLTGHKYSDVSSAKTVVDTVTAPVRALFPTPSIQQTTSVVSGGTNNGQTTTSTQITSGPPKN